MTTPEAERYIQEEFTPSKKPLSLILWDRMVLIAFTGCFFLLVQALSPFSPWSPAISSSPEDVARRFVMGGYRTSDKSSYNGTSTLPIFVSPPSSGEIQATLVNCATVQSTPQYSSGTLKASLDAEHTLLHIFYDHHAELSAEVYQTRS